MSPIQKKATFFAFLAAVLYAVNSPFSKLLLSKIPETMMAAFLYLGAGSGLFLVGLINKISGKKEKEKSLTKKELPYTIAMVVLDIAAPIFLMVGLNMTAAENASLLNNFEIVATSLIALFVFKEAISKKLGLAIFLVTLSSIILSLEDLSSFTFSWGSIFVLLASVCWGFENNCTRMLSSKDPLEIVVIKGFFSGLGSFIIALSIGEKVPEAIYVLFALVLGFVAYGLSIYFYIYAQRDLGAAKTSAYYAVAPFVGAGISFIIFREMPSVSYITGLVVMIIGTYFCVADTKETS